MLLKIKCFTAWVNIIPEGINIIRTEVFIFRHSRYLRVRKIEKYILNDSTCFVKNHNICLLKIMINGYVPFITKQTEFVETCCKPFGDSEKRTISSHIICHIITQLLMALYNKLHLYSCTIYMSQLSFKSRSLGFRQLVLNVLHSTSIN